MSLLSDFLIHTLHGVQYGFVLFLVASGMAIILGVLNILNLAHGELYAFGAFLSFTLIGIGTGIATSVFGTASGIVALGILLAAVIGTAIIMVPLGVLLERVFVRRVYDRPQVYQLVLTFALLLVIYDVIGILWTSDSVVRRDGIYSGINSLEVTTVLFGFSYPTFNLLTIVIGAIVLGGLIWFMNRTKTGKIIRAMTAEREMATALGINTDRMYALVFGLGAALAAISGAMIVPQAGAVVGMGTNPLVLAFVIMVIGGLGSIRGAFVGSMLVGVLSRWATWQYPPAETAAPFAIMIVILLIKPDGIYGTWGEIR